ncbi:MAG: hypothetical protein U0822_22185 [Anaerolineae bacterium]
MLYRRTEIIALGALLLAGLAFLNTLRPGGWTVWAAGPDAAPNALARSNAATPAAAIARTFAYQGVLRLANGALANGNYNLALAIYDVETGGTPLFEETLRNVPVRNGLFNVTLGETVAIGDAVFATGPRFLGVTVAPDPEMLPRQRIQAVPWALLATTLQPGATIQDANGSAQLVGADVGVAGSNANGSGVRGSSSNGIGVEGISVGGRAIFGSSTSGGGVVGTSTGGSGVSGSSSSGFGVEGFSNSFAGVSGTSNGDGLTAAGVYGSNTNGTGVGVYGVSTGNDGVYGTSSSGTGVHGYSDSSYGVYGESFGNAVPGAAVLALARNPDAGIAIYAANSSRDGTVVLSNGGTGDLIRAFAGGDNLFFRVDHDGNVYAHGSFRPFSLDYAEMLPAVEGPEPGDVLVVGPDGKLMRSTSAYQRNTAGVYSTQPGILAEAADHITGKVPLALLGVVPVKVTAENGAIAPGDLLVTSSVPGRAMKATPKLVGDVEVYPTGAVLAKALEPLADGQGVIQALLTLR